MENLYENGGFEAMVISENNENPVGETRSRANTSSGDETNDITEKRKRKEREGSSSEPLDDGEDESHVQKKKRVIWTSEMHRKFVDAIAQIGEDRAVPKKIIEEMNEPGLTRENVASHLQKYRINLKKSQEERDGYFQGLNAATGNSRPLIYNSSLGNYQHHYLGTSELASRNYLPLSTSSRSSLYRINTGIAASKVHLAPPSYSLFDGSSAPINTGNLHNEYSRRIEANNSFGYYGGEDINIMFGVLNKKPYSNPFEDHATSSSTSNEAFMGLRIADDGRSLLFGSSNRSETNSAENYSTKRNDFHHQESAAPEFSSFSIKNYAQESPLPPLPDFEDQSKEPSLPPLPEFSVGNSFPQLEAEENELIDFILQQDTSASLDQQNSLQLLASETLETAEMEQITPIFANNHSVTSLPPITSPWKLNMNRGSFSLINQEASVQPANVPWNMYVTPSPQAQVHK